MSGFEFINDKMVKGPNIKETHKTYSHKLTQTYPQTQITKHTLCAILEERMDNKKEGGSNSPDSNDQSSGNVIVHRSHSPDHISNLE